MIPSLFTHLFLCSIITLLEICFSPSSVKRRSSSIDSIWITSRRMISDWCSRYSWVSQRKGLWLTSTLWLGFSWMWSLLRGLRTFRRYITYADQCSLPSLERKLLCIKDKRRLNACMSYWMAKLDCTSDNLTLTTKRMSSFSLKGIALEVPITGSRNFCHWPSKKH